MHGYHETLINCGASPGAVRPLLCILRAGPRKTTCLSARANFTMIYRPDRTKFFAILRGSSGVLVGAGNAFAHATIHPRSGPRIETSAPVPYATRCRWSTRVLCPFHPTRATLKYVSSSRLWNLVNWVSPRVSRETFHRGLTIGIYVHRIIGTFSCGIDLVTLDVRILCSFVPVFHLL